MKKNKGFSLVELIIVIAIMAILAAAIAPALIRYIDKSRKADDVTAAGTIATAANAALANEAAYDAVATAMNGTTLVATANVQTAAAGFTAANTNYQKFVDEVNKNLTGNAAPKVKYKKEVGTTGIKPTAWALYLSNDTPQVYIIDATHSSSKDVQLSPSIHEEYQ